MAKYKQIIQSIKSGLAAGWSLSLIFHYFHTQFNYENT